MQTSNTACYPTVGLQQASPYFSRPTLPRASNPPVLSRVGPQNSLRPAVFPVTIESGQTTRSQNWLPPSQRYPSSVPTVPVRSSFFPARAQASSISRPSGVSSSQQQLGRPPVVQSNGLPRGSINRPINQRLTLPTAARCAPTSFLPTNQISRHNVPFTPRIGWPHGQTLPSPVGQPATVRATQIPSQFSRQNHTQSPNYSSQSFAPPYANTAARVAYVPSSPDYGPMTGKLQSQTFDATDASQVQNGHLYQSSSENQFDHPDGPSGCNSGAQFSYQPYMPRSPVYTENNFAHPSWKPSSPSYAPRSPVHMAQPSYQPCNPSYMPGSPTAFADDDDAGLLEAMDYFDSCSQQVAVPPAAADLIPPSEMDEDPDELNWMLDLADEQDAKESTSVAPKSVKNDVVLETARPLPTGVIQRVVASSFGSPGLLPPMSSAPHNAAASVKPHVQMRQQIITETIPITILEELPSGTQIPANLVSLPGFDADAGLNWLYPTNYPVRDYQYNIVQKSLFHNTMVCLPTGLGKTFIAAVVMYNFYRWYPKGKVVFMAPTKPLVNQQIRACYSVMGIPQSDMIEMTGSISPTRRAQLWTAKRIFFMTPQTAVNDLENDLFHAEDIKCLVVDEAHKSTGSYAYCTIVRLIAQRNKQFRVLALSATPGQDPAAIQVVLTNLLIRHLEIRQENSLDIIPYTHARTVQKIVVPLDPQIKSACDQMYRVILEYLLRLRSGNGIPAYLANEKLTSYMVMRLRQDFQSKNTTQGYIKQRMITMFMIVHSLFCAYESLQWYGLRSFYTYVHNTFRGKNAPNALAASEMKKNVNFDRLIGFVKHILDEDLSVLGVDGLMDTSFISPDRPYTYGHPKLRKLEELVLQHFEAPSGGTDSGDGQAGPSEPRNSRIMIFTTYRNSVLEITSMLKRHHPVIRVMKFIGQSSVAGQRKGLTQKEQTEVLERFRSGNYNVLVSTSVGEEGLDIGEVDLIICFDAQKGPLRNIQRSGRTGRARQGKCVMLITQGTEEDKYNKCVSNKATAKKSLERVDYQWYSDNPRMVPDGLKPVCVQLKIDMPPYVEPSGGLGGGRKKSSKGVLTAWLTKRPTVKETAKYQHDFLTDEELSEYGRVCKPIPETAPDEPTGDDKSSGRFLFDPLNFDQLAKRFRNRETVEPAMTARPGLSDTDYPAFQILLQTQSFLLHSKRTENFVAAMTQMSELSMPSGAPCDDNIVKLYGKAAKAGYIDLDGVGVASSSETVSASSSDGRSSIEPTPIIRWRPKEVPKTALRTGRLSNLSTPEDEVAEQEALEDFDKNEIDCDALHEDAEVVFRSGSKSMRRDIFESAENSIPEEDTVPDYDYGLLDDSDLYHFPSPLIDGATDELPLVEHQRENDPVAQEPGYSDYNIDKWDTWNDDEGAPAQPAVAKGVNESVLVDATTLASARERDSEGSILGLTAALSFINRTDVIPETPLIPAKCERKIAGSVVRSGVLNFEEDAENNIDLGTDWENIPFGHRKGGAVVEEEKVDETMPDIRTIPRSLGRPRPSIRSEQARIEETLPYVPVTTGPNSHSTPVLDRTRRKLPAAPGVSPVTAHIEPASSPSYIPCSFGEENEQNETPGSVLEDPDVLDGMRNSLNDLDSGAGKCGVVRGVSRRDVFDETRPFLTERINGAALVRKSDGKIDGPANKPVVNRTCSTTSAQPGTSRPGEPSKCPGVKTPRNKCRIPATDDSEDDVIVFRGRRKRPVAFETPSPGRANSAFPNRNGLPGQKDNSCKPSVRAVTPRNPIRKLNKKRQKTTLEIVQKKAKLAVKPRLKAMDFFDDEAEVSGDDSCSADESSEDESNLDEYPSDLIASQSPVADPSYMQAVYARHGRDSPPTDEVLRRMGPRRFHNTNIFSQEFVQDDDYGSSSFVVYSDEEDENDHDHEEEESLVMRKKRPPAKKDQAVRPAKGWNHDFQPPRRKMPRN